MDGWMNSVFLVGRRLFDRNSGRDRKQGDIGQLKKRGPISYEKARVAYLYIGCTLNLPFPLHVSPTGLNSASRSDQRIRTPAIRSSMNVSSGTRTSVPTRLDSRCNAARESLTDAPQMTSRSSTRLWSLMTALWGNTNDFHPSRCVPSEIRTSGSRHGGESAADHVRHERESRSRHSWVRSVWVRVLRDRRVIDGIGVHAESGERWTS